MGRRRAGLPADDGAAEPEGLGPVHHERRGCGAAFLQLDARRAVPRALRADGIAHRQSAPSEPVRVAGRVPLRQGSRARKPLRHGQGIPVHRHQLPADGARALRHPARPRAGRPAAVPVRGSSRRRRQGERHPEWRSGPRLLQARQARGRRHRDETPGPGGGRRQEGLPHRYPHPLGVCRHRGRSRSDQGRQLAGQRADAVRRRRQLANAGVQGVPGQHREDLMVEPLAPSPMEAWTRRRRRVRELLDRHAFARQILALYEKLLDVQERAYHAVLDDRPAPDQITGYIADRVVTDVVAATVGTGPETLVASAGERLLQGRLTEMIADWLGGHDQPPIDRYIARAASEPVLQALGPDAGGACRGSQKGHTVCRRCGGLPQLSYFPESGEALVSAPRSLVCARCTDTWVFERMTCPGCGESLTARLPIYADDEKFAHLRADACESCRRYLITVDLRKAPDGVPVVDELAALPLDLYVQKRGFTKIVPNLMQIG